MEHVVSILVSEQISEDRWEVVRKTLKVTSETTISQIEAWYRTYIKSGPMHFEVNQLETL